MMATRPQRYREFYYLIYPESTDLKKHVKALEDSALMYCISPLHDSDLKDEETGEMKKAHYHCAILYDSLKSVQQMQDFAETLGIKHIELPRASRRQGLRYFCHLDSKGKTKYDPADVITGNGFDYSDVLNYTETDSPDALLLKYLQQMQKDSENHITFKGFVFEIVRAMPELLPHLVKRAYFFNIMCYNERDQDRKFE